MMMPVYAGERRIMAAKILSETHMRNDPSKSFTFVIPSVNGDTGAFIEAVSAVEEYPLSLSDNVVFLGGNTSSPAASNIVALMKAYHGLKPTMTTFCMGPSEHKFLYMNKKFVLSKEGREVLQGYRKDKLNFTVLRDDRLWLSKNLDSYYADSKYFVSHGGVYCHDKLHMDRYPSTLLVYGRDQFKTSKQLFDKTVVYSETSDKPVIKQGRIGVGTRSVIVLDNMSSDCKPVDVLKF